MFMSINNGLTIRVYLSVSIEYFVNNIYIYNIYPVMFNLIRCTCGWVPVCHTKHYSMDGTNIVVLSRSPRHCSSTVVVMQM